MDVGGAILYSFVAMGTARYGDWPEVPCRVMARVGHSKRNK